MNISDDISFDEWFYMLESKCRNLGYDGPIDKYTFEWEYLEGNDPEISAEDFVKEMNEL